MTSILYVLCKGTCYTFLIQRFIQQIGLMNDCVLWHISIMFEEVYNPSINVYTNCISS